MKLETITIATWVVLLTVYASCSENNAAGCVEGDTQPCTCAGGASGAQVCQDDKTWDECDCGGGDGDTDTDTDTDADTDSNGTLSSGCNKMDILFVIDNSDSMSEEQDNLIASFPAFIEAIEAYDVIGTDEPLDYHVGVISTEVDHNECGDFTCDFVEGDDGVLQNTPVGNNGVCDPPELPYMVGPDPAVTDEFACVAALGTLGYPWEMPLEAIRRGMTDGFDGEGHLSGENAGFLRDDALFVAIIITDEDDVSRVNTYPTNPWAPTPDPNLVSDYVAEYLNIKDSYEKMAFGLISGPLNTDCETSWGDAFAAPRLHELLTLVGSNGAWGNLCDEDLPAAIETILETVALACDEMPVII